jgi:hypothetical protein
MTYDQQCETVRFAKRKDTSVHPNDLNSLRGGCEMVRFGRGRFVSLFRGFWASLGRNARSASQPLQSLCLRAPDRAVGKSWGREKVAQKSI